MDGNYLKGHDADRINAVLAAAGFNFHLPLRLLAPLLRAIFLAALQCSPALSLFTSGGTSQTTCLCLSCRFGLCRRSGCDGLCACRVKPARHRTGFQ
jgi:hypothetical protein